MTDCPYSVQTYSSDKIKNITVAPYFSIYSIAFLQYPAAALEVP